MFEDIMRIPLIEAERARDRGEVPVGAMLRAPDGTVLARDGNRMRERADPMAHAEMLVLAEGLRRVGTGRLTGCTLAVTLEPCAMCAGAIAHARIARLYYGAEDPKGGAVVSGPRIFAHPTAHHRPDVISGLRATECTEILQRFFAMLRN